MLGVKGLIDALYSLIVLMCRKESTVTVVKTESQTDDRHTSADIRRVCLSVCDGLTVVALEKSLLIIL